MSNVTDAAETRLITKTQMAKVREVDFTYKFEHDSLANLIKVLGVTRKIPMQEGTTMYVYTTTGTLQPGSVSEGAIIPLSQYQRNKTAVGEITLNKWRKAVSAEAIMKSGKEEAINQTDAAMLRDVQKKIRTDFFTLLNGTITGATSVNGTGLQEALAEAWGQLQVKFEDDTAEAVYFLNPLDVADYLAAANITTQTVFGMRYIEDFLGLGTVILTSNITQGTFKATAKENLVMYYLNMNGDVADEFNLTVDELGYIGICTEIPTHNRMQIETLIASGIQFFVEYAAGVVTGTINGTTAKLTVNSVASASNSGKTVITYSGYTKGASDILKYLVGDNHVSIHDGESLSGWTTWNGSDEITAATGKILTLAVCDSSANAIAVGDVTVTAKA
ncbi:MAG: hypothetical protein II517_02540 [Ruminococcus sp.]|nr:hypothetical protein [Ruminococcus sp.]